jgi:hypothetical protein
MLCLNGGDCNGHGMVIMIVVIMMMMSVCVYVHVCVYMCLHACECVCAVEGVEHGDGASQGGRRVSSGRRQRILRVVHHTVAHAALRCDLSGILEQGAAGASGVLVEPLKAVPRVQAHTVCDADAVCVLVHLLGFM